MAKKQATPKELAELGAGIEKVFKSYPPEIVNRLPKSIRKQLMGIVKAGKKVSKIKR
jgi:hypothetical protein